MRQNPFDQASRYATKLDPPGLLGWLFAESELLFEFRGWLDTRTLPFPGDPERTCDTVAWLRHRQRPEHWAVPIEFNLEPDSLMFGRLLVYLGQLWQEQRLGQQGAGRYQVGAVVINLTGRGQTSRDMQLGPVRTSLQVIERNLSQEDAASVLQGIGSGSVARCLLPWVPLMRGGDELAIVDRWKELAGAEADWRRQADYGGLARVFAEAADRGDPWKEALKEWNMKESQTVLEWIAEGEIKGEIKALLRLLTKKFPPAPPADIAAAIQACADLDRLGHWFDAAIDAPTLEDFRRAMQP